ncbi:MAG: xanthine dehydrogenase family protein subunit M [Pyrinomonadaceae bacterium]
MRPFKYTEVADAAAATRALAANVDAKFLAGGTNLVDLMREYIARPSEIVDIKPLGMSQIQKTAGGISIGALARNTDTANHPLVRKDFPLLTMAILAGASPQIRNMATNGGNLMQRTRCQYFYDLTMPCNKREKGSGCGALDGLNRMHAIFGHSQDCVATYPGDMANALYALDAIIKVRGVDGKERSIPAKDFHRLPGNAPEKDNELAHGELITSIEIPNNKFAERSYYLKVRDRASYAFALVAVAAALEVEGGTIKQARVVLGGVAHKPWRSAEAETSLMGKKPDRASFEAAAAAALVGAKPLSHNGYKVELAKRSIVVALERAMGVTA